MWVRLNREGFITSLALQFAGCLHVVTESVFPHRVLNDKIHLGMQVYIRVCVSVSVCTEKACGRCQQGKATGISHRIAQWLKKKIENTDQKTYRIHERKTNRDENTEKRKRKIAVSSFFIITDPKISEVCCTLIGQMLKYSYKKPISSFVFNDGIG